MSNSLKLNTMTKLLPSNIEINNCFYVLFINFLLLVDIMVDHVSWRLATGATSQLVCLLVRLRVYNFLKQALNVNLSSSHSHKKFLFFFVRGRKYIYSLGLR